MINGGVQLSENATLEEVVNVLNQLIGDFSVAESIATDGANNFALQSDASAIWVLSSGFLVLFMHTGFAMLEAGSIQYKNVINVLFKNTVTLCITGLVYYLFGFAFAYGTDNQNENSFSFIGSGNYALSDIGGDGFSWFFQYAFAATSATIVSGAVAGRVHLIGYFAIASYITAFVYPVVSHWIWATGGFASAFTERDDTLFGPEGCGFIDFAGSGVVHLTGGCSAFWAAYIVGPRIGRFGPGGVVNKLPPHNLALLTLGTLVLWFGWYGFNCGSTLALDGVNAGHVAVTTTLSATCAGLTGVFVSRAFEKKYVLPTVLNSVLAGLVSITAGCSVVDFWAAIIIGFIGAFVFYAGSTLMVKAGIDDPVDAIAVHGFCGTWGCLAVGIFASPGNIARAYSTRRDPECRGWETGLQFGTQLVVVLTIIAWVTLTTLPYFTVLKYFQFLRVSAEVEQAGIDSSEHGGSAAYFGDDNEKGMQKPAQESEKTAESIARS